MASLAAAIPAVLVIVTMPTSVGLVIVGSHDLRRSLFHIVLLLVLRVHPALIPVEVVAFLIRVIAHVSSLVARVVVIGAIRPSHVLIETILMVATVVMLVVVAASA